MNDRAADNWRFLFAIADLAGADWPERARRAAVTLSGQVEPHDGAGEQLLGDIRASFLERGVERIFTDDLLRDLMQREDRPWRERRNGKPLTATQLANWSSGRAACTISDRHSGVSSTKLTTMLNAPAL